MIVSLEAYGTNAYNRYAMCSRVRQRPEEGRRTYRLKRCGNNNKDEDNCPKTLNDKKYHGSIFIRKAELILRRHLGEDSNNALTERMNR